MLTRSKRETKGNEISIIANLKRIITFDRRREEGGGGVDGITETSRYLSRNRVTSQVHHRPLHSRRERGEIPGKIKTCGFGDGAEERAEKQELRAKNGSLARGYGKPVCS